MRRFIILNIFSLIFFGSILPSCGPSPLFHHRKEQEPQSGAPQNADLDKKPESPSDGSSSKEPAIPSQPFQCGLDWGADECWELQWIKGPIQKKESAFRLILRSKSSGDLLPSEFAPQIDLWMPDMNHGSAPVTIIRESESSFLISKVYFIMRGLWQIRLKNDRDILTYLQVVLP